MNKEEVLKSKIKQLIEENMKLHEQLENGISTIAINNGVRKLTLQEKLDINAGVYQPKYRIPAKELKDIYYTVIREEKEPEFIDMAFNDNRMFSAYYIVDMDKEIENITKGEDLKLDISKIPSNMSAQEHHYDVSQVLDKLVEVEEK